MAPAAAPRTSAGGKPMHPEGASGSPVRYFNGELRLAATDLATSGFCAEFGHTRIFSNRLGGDRDLGNGFNWMVRQLPRAYQQGDSISVLRGSRSAVRFVVTKSGSDKYAGSYGTKFAITQNAGNYTLTAPNGETTVFNDFDSAQAGLLSSHTTAGGQTLEVTSYAPTTVLGIGEVRRTYAGSDTTTVESYLYSFTGIDLAGVLLRRSTDGGGSWTNIRRVAYDYYDGLDGSGLAGDLKSATVQSFDGSAWQTIDNSYYRYSTTTAGGIGLPHGVKYVVQPRAYAAMVAAGLDPVTASDAQLAGYADLYVEYDGQRRVTKEVTDGGQYAYTFAYTANTNPGYVDDYNNWLMKTVEMRPDGSINTVYTNYVGDVILKQLSDGSDAWIETTVYDGSANVLQYAYPSAVAGCDDSQNDLGITYNADSGLIRLYTYYAGSSPSSSSGSSSSSSSSGESVDAPNYLASESVKEGSEGTPVLLKQYAYTAQSVGGATIYPTASVTEYRDDGGGEPITTSYNYLFFSGTTAVQQRATTWPIVTTDQNGSGIADSRVEQFDQWGNHTQLTDERGVVTQFVVDVPTGAVSQRIDDATGMELETDYQFDVFGRTTQQLGPTHTIDLDGVATAVRTVTWTVYQDALEQVWTAQGYATGASPNYTYTLVNPVSITIMDAEGSVSDQVSAIRASTSGALSASDSFPQSSYCRWTHSVAADEIGIRRHIRHAGHGLRAAGVAQRSRARGVVKTLAHRCLNDAVRRQEQHHTLVVHAR